MSYQNVSSCRFFVNCIEWMHSLDQVTSSGGFGIEQYFTTSASNPQYNIPNDADGDNDTESLPKFGTIPYNAIMGDKSFIAFLGHNFKSADCEMLIQEGSPDYNGIQTVADKVNWGSVGAHPRPDYNGFSMATCDISHWQQTGNANNIRFESGEWGEADPNPYNGLGGVTFGAIVMGTYYDMSNAPNLSLTMSRDYGGINEFTTYNGGSMSNTMWNSTPKWGDLGAWELGDSNPALSRSGRRSWDLKFSSMDDADLWGSNQSLSFLDVVNNTTFDYNLLTDDNFFSQVWHKTLGGTLPFIFQPDGGVNGNNNPDQFCIARFKDNSLKATQSSPNTYDISLSIEEVW